MPRVLIQMRRMSLSAMIPGMAAPDLTPHTGFKDPTTAPDALPRQSIEIRAYVFWENEQEQDIARLL